MTDKETTECKHEWKCSAAGDSLKTWCNDCGKVFSDIPLDKLVATLPTEGHER